MRTTGAGRAGGATSGEPLPSSELKIFRVLDGPSRQRGFGISATLNEKVTVHLLLDTGASGISLSPGMAEKAGLQRLDGVASEVQGFGDEKPQVSLGYLASEVRIGDLIFADYPVSVFAQNPNFDGRIGADVFGQFLLKLDFVHLAASLEARPGGEPELFLVDSGSLDNVIDLEAARNFGNAGRDSNRIFGGPQGPVNDVSARNMPLSFLAACARTIRF